MGVDFGLVGGDFDLLRWRREVGGLVAEGERVSVVVLVCFGFGVVSWGCFGQVKDLR